MIFRIKTRWSDASPDKCEPFERTHTREAANAFGAIHAEEMHNTQRAAAGMHAEGWRWTIVACEAI